MVELVTEGIKEIVVTLVIALVLVILVGLPLTSFAFILGCVPLWIATGAGSVARQIMGTTVIGGMLAASVIGIFFVPAIFFLVEKWSGASKEQSPTALPGTPAPAEGD